MTIKGFLKKHGLRFGSRRVERNPFMSDDVSWSIQASHWKCVFALPDGRRWGCYFSMGAAHSGPPKPWDVLDCLASDAASIRDTRGFEDWAESFGYDTDSRRAYKTFQVCKRQADRLMEFLEPERFEELLYKVERG